MGDVLDIIKKIADRDISIVTNCDHKIFSRYIINKDKKGLKNEVDEIDINDDKILKYITCHPSKNEYIEIWEGPSYFSEQKFLSHIMWSLLDGITGKLYEEFSLQNPYFYSFKYFPREIYDGGYSVLYVDAGNIEARNNIRKTFIKLLESLSLELDELLLEQIKRKLLTIQKNSNCGEQLYMNMASYLLFEPSIDDFLNYEEQLLKINLEDVRNYIKSFINKKSIVLT